MIHRLESASEGLGYRDRDPVNIHDQKYPVHRVISCTYKTRALQSDSHDSLSSMHAAEKTVFLSPTSPETAHPRIPALRHRRRAEVRQKGPRHQAWP